MLNTRELKIEPYEACPCDSGSKFKFCCYPTAKKGVNLRSKEIYSYPDKRLEYVVNGYWEDTDFKICLGSFVGKCSGKAISSHSIQNNRILNRISEESHLYEIGSKLREKEIILEFRKISKNNASTFFGFCQEHDTVIFKPIERDEYRHLPVQNYLFAFRSLALEYHKKERELRSIKKVMRDFPHTMLNSDVVYRYRLCQLDVRDYKKYYYLFRNGIQSENYGSIRTYQCQLDFEIQFAACSSFSIAYDLKGKRINDKHSLSNNVSLIFFNAYPVEGATNILISYFEQDELKYKSYFDQLEGLSQSNLIKYLNYLIIEHTENIFLKLAL
jgi:hypothetical protein